MKSCHHRNKGSGYRLPNPFGAGTLHSMTHLIMHEATVAKSLSQDCICSVHSYIRIEALHHLTNQIVRIGALHHLTNQIAGIVTEKHVLHTHDTQSSQLTSSWQTVHIMEFDLGERVFVQTDGLSFVNISHHRRDSTRTGIKLAVKSWQNLLRTNEQLVVDMFNILTKGQWVN